MEFRKPESVSEACELKNKHKGNAAFIAGGTDLMIDIRDRALEEDFVIDISDLNKLDYVDIENDTVRIGSTTKAVSIEKSKAVKKVPLVKKVFKKFANPLIKNQATIGGNIISASPAADMAPLLLVLNAKVTLKNIDGRRTIPISDLFEGVKSTNEKKDEILTEISFKIPEGNLRSDFQKLSERRASAISTASLAILYDIVEGNFMDPKISLGAVAPIPIRAINTEKVLDGSEVSKETIEKAKDSLRKEVSPITDLRGTKDYRREVSGQLLQKAFNNTLEGFL